MTTEVVRLPTATDVTTTARDAFADEQRQLIRRTIAPDASEAEFDLFLDISARYQLNPLHGEIWLAKMPGRNGAAPKFTVIVGRDGFLKCAQRDPNYNGMESDVVRAFDTFKVRHTRDGIEVIHEYDLGFDDFAGVEAQPQRTGGDPTKDEQPTVIPATPGQPAAGAENSEQRTLRKRGRIIGAWALVHRKDRKASTFVFCPWGEYAPNDVSRNRAWRETPSAMIRKCAVSNALREAFSLSGLYADAEMERALATGEPVDHSTMEPDYGDDALGARLRALVERVNEVKPGSWRPAKVRTVLAGASEEERTALAEALERDITAAGGSLPDEVIDAEVVEDAGEREVAA